LPDLGRRLGKVGLSNTLGRALVGGICLAMAIAMPGLANCEFFAEPQRYNTQRNGDVIVIGAQPDRRYRVVIVGDDAQTYKAVSDCILDAFIAQSRLGPYIQVGSFDRRADAETIVRILRRQGYGARTVYRQ
jgi:hypothetical protein